MTHYWKDVPETPAHGSTLVYVDVDVLSELDACTVGIRWFQKAFGDNLSVVWTVEHQLGMWLQEDSFLHWAWAVDAGLLPWWPIDGYATPEDVDLEFDIAHARLWDDVWYGGGDDSSQRA